MLMRPPEDALEHERRCPDVTMRECSCLVSNFTFTFTLICHRAANPLPRGGLGRGARVAEARARPLVSEHRRACTIPQPRDVPRLIA